MIKPTKPGKTNSDQIWTYEQIVQKINLVKDVFKARGISLHHLSVLAQIFDKASILSKEWTAGERTDGWLDRLLAAAHAVRISEAVVDAKDDEAARECFKRISKDNMNLSEREQAQGKDSLWELELLSYFRRHGVSASMAEPDILVHTVSGDYPVACKKINSDQGVENQIKKACKQLGSFCGHGVIALNIDETTPANVILASQSCEEASDHLSKLLRDFKDRHVEAMQGAVKKGKCDGFVLSVTVLSDLENSRPRFNNHVEMLCWNLSDGPANARGRFQTFAKTLSSSIGPKGMS